MHEPSCLQAACPAALPGCSQARWHLSKVLPYDILSNLGILSKHGRDLPCLREVSGCAPSAESSMPLRSGQAVTCVFLTVLTTAAARSQNRSLPVSHLQLRHRQAPHAPSPQLWPGHPEHPAPPSEHRHPPLPLPTLVLCLPPLQVAPVSQREAALRNAQHPAVQHIMHMWCYCGLLTVSRGSHPCSSCMSMHCCWHRQG